MLVNYVFLLSWSGSTFPEEDPDPAKWCGSETLVSTYMFRYNLYVLSVTSLDVAKELS